MSKNIVVSHNVTMKYITLIPVDSMISLSMINQFVDGNIQIWCHDLRGISLMADSQFHFLGIVPYPPPFLYSMSSAILMLRFLHLLRHSSKDSKLLSLPPHP